MAEPIAPKIVSFVELQLTLMPYLLAMSNRNKRAALADLHDLWVMGAPVPNQRIMPEGQEQRVLLPTQFAAWWGNVCKRYGYDPSQGPVRNG